MEDRALEAAQCHQQAMRKRGGLAAGGYTRARFASFACQVRHALTSKPTKQLVLTYGALLLAPPSRRLMLSGCLEHHLKGSTVTVDTPSMYNADRRCKMRWAQAICTASRQSIKRSVEPAAPMVCMLCWCETG